MANGLSLDAVLNELHKTAQAEAPAKPVEKAATKTESTKVAAAKTELVDALKRAEAAATTKTAAAAAPAAPAADLQKIAADLAAADQEAIVKEANLYGAAVADGFMARLGQYEQAAGNEKVAAAPADVEKIAAEAVRGYVETQQQLKVAAAQEFKRGYNDARQEIEKIASDVYGQGIADCNTVLQHLANQ